ncbi:unnamed protein product, partial [Durusdinium trenchii]
AIFWLAAFAQNARTHCWVTMQADSCCMRLSLADGAVQIVARNTFLDVDMVPPDTQELCRTKSCPALLNYKKVEHHLDIEDAKTWARLTTGSTQCPEDTVGEQHLSESDGEGGDADWQSVSTVMIKNIPCRCTTEEVLAAVDRLGFAGAYDFFYLPINRRHRQGIGYAFINFPQQGAAGLFKKAIAGYQFPGRKSQKVVHVAKAQLQGRQEVDAYFHHTQVLHTRYGPVMS